MTGYPPPYGDQDHGYQHAPHGYAQQPPTNTMAVLALVFAFVFSPLGIVFGIIGRRQIERTGESGRGLATAGLVIGSILTAFALLYIIGIIVVFVMLASTTP